MNLEDMMAADSPEAMGDLPANEQLEQLRSMVARQLEIEGWIAQMEERLDRAFEAWRDIAEKQIPEKIKELGLASFTLDDGRKVEVKEEMYLSLKEEKKQAAYAWLRENKVGSIIKNVVSVQLGKGDDEKAKQVAEFIAELGMIPERDESVHSSTLKATIKELMGKGKDVPLEMFGAFIVNRSLVSDNRPKKKERKGGPKK